MVAPQAPRVCGGAEAKVAATADALPVVLIADKLLCFQCRPPDSIPFPTGMPITCKVGCSMLGPQLHCGCTIPGARLAGSGLMGQCF